MAKTCRGGDTGTLYLILSVIKYSVPLTLPRLHSRRRWPPEDCVADPSCEAIDEEGEGVRG